MRCLRLSSFGRMIIKTVVKAFDCDTYQTFFFFFFSFLLFDNFEKMVVISFIVINVFNS